MRIGDLEAVHIGDRFDQMHAPVDLAHRAFDFRVAGMADHDDLAALGAQALDFEMNLGDQRAGGVEDAHTERLSFVAHRARHAMRGKHHGRPGRDDLQVLNEHRAFGTQVFDHETVVHDLVPHINRRAELRDRALDDLDRPIDPGTKAARLGEQ